MEAILSSYFILKCVNQTVSNVTAGILTSYFILIRVNQNKRLVI